MGRCSEQRHWWGWQCASEKHIFVRPLSRGFKHVRCWYVILHVPELFPLIRLTYHLFDTGRQRFTFKKMVFLWKMSSFSRKETWRASVTQMCGTEHSSGSACSRCAQGVSGEKLHPNNSVSVSTPWTQIMIQALPSPNLPQFPFAVVW